MLEHQMRHLNNNALCAVFVETTGDNPRTCDIVEICIMLADNFIKPSQLVMPFYNQIAPFRPENVNLKTASVSKEKILNAVKNGLEPSLAADRLEEWFNHLNLPSGKKIVPLTLNWPDVREFLHTWLGFYNFNHIFSHEYRDLMSSALFMNDVKNQRAKECFYPKPQLLGYLAHQHKLAVTASSDVMEKALKAMEVYRLMLKEP